MKRLLFLVLTLCSLQIAAQPFKYFEDASARKTLTDASTLQNKIRIKLFNNLNSFLAKQSNVSKKPLQIGYKLDNNIHKAINKMIPMDILEVLTKDNKEQNIDAYFAAVEDFFTSGLDAASTSEDKYAQALFQLVASLALDDTDKYDYQTLIQEKTLFKRLLDNISTETLDQIKKALSQNIPDQKQKARALRLFTGITAHKKTNKKTEKNILNTLQNKLKKNEKEFLSTVSKYTEKNLAENRALFLQELFNNLQTTVNKKQYIKEVYGTAKINKLIQYYYKIKKEKPADTNLLKLISAFIEHHPDPQQHKYEAATIVGKRIVGNLKKIIPNFTQDYKNHLGFLKDLDEYQKKPGARQEVITGVKDFENKYIKNKTFEQARAQKLKMVYNDLQAATNPQEKIHEYYGIEKFKDLINYFKEVKKEDPGAYYQLKIIALCIENHPEAPDRSYEIKAIIPYIKEMEKNINDFGKLIVNYEKNEPTAEQIKLAKKLHFSPETLLAISEAIKNNVSRYTATKIMALTGVMETEPQKKERIARETMPLIKNIIKTLHPQSKHIQNLANALYEIAQK